MLEVKNLCKSYVRRAEKVEVLKNLDFTADEGEFVSIVGASGSGKSTFLHVVGTLDTADQGEVWLGKKRIDNLRGKERDLLRNETFGFVFQFYHLLPELNAIDNVLMAAYIRHTAWSWWKARKTWRKRAEELLERVGLGHRKTHRPHEMSGGEMQRAAVARALLTSPRMLLADEPTGNLDTNTGGEIVGLLKQLNQEDKVTIIMVTHNNELAQGTDRVLRMTAGRFDDDQPPASLPYPKPKILQTLVG